jgi:hypothetical protein
MYAHWWLRSLSVADHWWGHNDDRRGLATTIVRVACVHYWDAGVDGRWSMVDGRCVHHWVCRSTPSLILLLGWGCVEWGCVDLSLFRAARYARNAKRPSCEYRNSIASG